MYNRIIENKPIPSHTELHYTSIDTPSTSCTICNFEVNATQHTTIDTVRLCLLSRYLVITYPLPSILIMTVWKLKYFYHFFFFTGIWFSIEYYAKSNKLNGPLRNKLSHVLLHIFLKKCRKKISTEKLIVLSQEICYLFPNENKEAYYTPYKNEASV